MQAGYFKYHAIFVCVSQCVKKDIPKSYNYEKDCFFYTILCCAAAVFVACDKDKEENFAATGNENGHDYVDLGLSVKWATCNIGATAPESYGNYYAWGETTTKDTCTWNNYKFGSTLNKYNSRDSITTLEAADDAATQNWGGKWRMPTNKEWTELRTNCTWTWTTQNGVSGYEVKASNGNAIFLPAAGYRYMGNLKSVGKDGYYLSSSLYTDDPNCIWCVFFYSYGVSEFDTYRYLGLSIRPICE